MSVNYVLDFADITLRDVARVGGKNASLGELFRVLKPRGVGVLDGFATTAEAYHRLLETNGLEHTLRSIFTSFDAEDLAQLAEKGDAARRSVLETPLPDELRRPFSPGMTGCANEQDAHLSWPFDRRRRPRICRRRRLPAPPTRS